MGRCFDQGWGKAVGTEQVMYQELVLVGGAGGLIKVAETP